MKVRVRGMPRKKDPAFKSNGKTFDTQFKAIENWERENPRKMIGFRVTPEAKELIEDYIEQKAFEENERFNALSAEEKESVRRKYTTEQGRASVTALLQYLLEEEMGVDLSPEKKEKKKPGVKPKSKD